MLLDPKDINWTKADDSTVWYAARDGVPAAKAELRVREAKAEAAARRKATL